MKTAFLVIPFMLTVSAYAQHLIQDAQCNGLIHGVVIGQDRQPVKGIGLALWPLGVDLAVVLPHTQTNQAGEYRFETVCPGRYTVLPEDEKAGFRESSPRLFEFLYGHPVADVKLTAAHTQKELQVDLPRRPGVMQVHAISRETKAEILRFKLELKVPEQHKWWRLSLLFDPSIQGREIEVPPDKEFVLRVVADGFHEWGESAEHGRVTHISSGALMTLNVELEPLRNGNPHNQKMSMEEWLRSAKIIDCLGDGKHWICVELEEGKEPTTGTPPVPARKPWKAGCLSYEDWDRSRPHPWNSAQPEKKVAPRLTSTRGLQQYVGTYPCSNGLLKQPVLLDSLKNALRRDYQAYRKHMQLSGCGAIERRDGFLLMDVSQLHVGGYSSLIFVRLTDGMLFVFWLKSTVADKQWQFYGPRPIPETVTQTVETEMNKEWGHVARFKVRGEQLDIELTQ